MPARPTHLSVPSSTRAGARTKDAQAAPVSALVSWRAVAAAGGVAWLLVGGLTLAVWASSHRPNTATALPSVPETTATGNANPSEPILQSPEPLAAETGERTPLDQPVSFKKAPASPPLPPEEKEFVTQEPMLPASELGLGEEVASCRNYGTQVAFVSSSTEAARKALKERKLLFVLHLAGNFEDKTFT